MAFRSTAEALLWELSRLLAPLERAAQAEQPEGIIDFLAEADIDAFDLLENAEPVVELAGIIRSAYGFVEDFVNEREIPEDLTVDELIAHVRDTFGAIEAWEGFSLIPATDAGHRLLSHLITEYLQTYHGPFYDFLGLVGVVEWEDDGEGSRRIDFGQMLAFLRQPDAHLAGLYGWGSKQFPEAVRVLLLLLQRWLWQAYAPAVMQAPSPRQADVLLPGGGEHVDGEDEADPQLRIPLLILQRGDAVVQFGIALLPVPPDEGTEDGGSLALIPFGTAAVAGTVPLGDGWRLVVRTSADAPADYALVIGPGRVELISLDQAAEPPSLNAEAIIERETAEADRVLLVATAEGARLDAGTVGLRLGLDFVAGTGVGGDAVFVIALPVHGARLVLPPPRADGFLGSILPANGAQVDFSFTLGWSSLHGFHFEGSSSLDVTLPQHVEIGPVRIDQLTLELVPGEEDGPDAGAIRLAASGNIKAALGPAMVTVEGLGLEASLAFPEERDGNLGIIDFRSAVKPPTGAGLAVDAATVVGGGYLALDPDKGRYVGAVHLEFQEKLVLKAVGILTTRMPDRSEGYSLLVIISAEFAPVQLGFGFTLNGVGGLLGVHRRAAVAVLRDGLKAGTLGSVLFPDDPVANAPRLISDLEAVFPMARDRYVIGPMAILGWGSPSILTAEIGVVIHLPAPVELILLGRLRMALPAEESAVVVVNMDVLGVVDFDRGTLALDATLFDSRLTRFALSGDMALRAGWAPNPNFALAVGGLHPDYEPPPAFPELDRIAVSLTTGNNPRLRLEAYLALTANTAQVGARLDAYAEKHVALVGDISVSAWLYFDVLFRFSPFGFVAAMGAGATLRRNGRLVMTVDLDLRVAGPAPGRARGLATAKVCGIEVSVSFDRRFSSEERPSLPEADPFAELVAALKEPGNWSGALPAGAHALVSLRKTAAGDAPVRIHPLGALTVRQSVVPLATDITQFGATTFELDVAEDLNLPVPVAITVPQRRRFTVGDIELNGTADFETSPVRDYFAPGQYLPLSDAERLAAPSYQRLTGGLQIGTAEVAAPTDAAVESQIAYHETVIDEASDRFRWRAGEHLLADATLHAAARYGARARSALDHSGAARFRGPDAGIRLEEPSYRIARTDDLTAVTLPGLAYGAAGLAHLEAVQLLNDHLTAHRQDANRLQVVSAAEVMQQ